MRILTPLLLALSFFAFAARAEPPANDKAELRVMSFNVRNSHAQDGDNGWKFRKPLFFQVIHSFDPDLLGTQEVLADQYDDITADMKGYTPVGVARDDGKRKGEWSLIMFRTSRFDLLDSGTFWLSEHPDQPGSVSWDAALTRICSWAVLKDHVTGHEFVFAATHFDHKGPEARRHSAQLIHDHLPELAKGKPVILAGDFNTHETDPPYKTLAAAGWIDSYREVHPTPTTQEASFNGFKPITAGKRIDFIFHTKELKAISATIDRTHGENNRLPSDHYPVTAVLEFKP